jgi:hypothetical protein
MAGTPSILPNCVELALPPAERLRQKFARDSYVICHEVIAADDATTFRDRALQVAAAHARRIEQQSAGHVLRYRVVTGDVIREQWPEVFALYTSARMGDWVRDVTAAERIFPSSHMRSAININALGEPGEIYRWHHDAAGFTLLLYLTDSALEDGGALELQPPDRAETITILPESGMAVLMDGTRCLHRAAPILRQHQRISIPMVFTTTADHARPAGLDDYLYR